ncbi:MAG TPA: AAA family ATPase [Chloroflexota bacterium]|nr:AAA family ATPase [Chloroflexota bacterium]
MTALLLITGHPASGKTTLGTRLAHDLRWPFFSKDGIKEVLFDTLGWSDREWSQRLGVAAFGVLYSIAAAELAAGRSVILEANFDPDHASPELRRLQGEHPFTPIQILCWARGETLQRRFRERDESPGRHPGHVDRTVYPTLAARLATERIAPVDTGEALLEVDTTHPATMPYDDIVRWVRAAAGCGADGTALSR